MVENLQQWTGGVSRVLDKMKFDILVVISFDCLHSVEIHHVRGNIELNWNELSEVESMQSNFNGI